jgi:hypothetical protein
MRPIRAYEKSEEGNHVASGHKLHNPMYKLVLLFAQSLDVGELDNGVTATSREVKVDC